jgi:hypothetical protein
MSTDQWRLTAGAVACVAAIVIMLVAWWWTRRPHGAPTAVGANPNPDSITDEMWWFWQQLQALEPTSQLGGVYAAKPGYHNKRRNLPAWDYSVTDDPPDKDGPDDKAAAIDWTFPDAQRGDYSTIAKYTQRLIDSGADPHDPRMDGWRECFGNADSDSYVEGWDFRYGVPSTSDSSHLWHIHLSESRSQTTSRANKEACLSVLRGETVAQWLGRGRGEGAVLVQCPYDDKRQDLFYVLPDGRVGHTWGNGIGSFWDGKATTETLGGTVAAGTLTAMWKPDNSGLYIAGLGAPDTHAPDHAGQMWGMELGRDGRQSGWGTFEGCYGAIPGWQVSAGRRKTELTALGLAVLALLVAVVALIVTTTT